MNRTTCPKCRVSTSGSYRFCPECGAGMTAEPTGTHDGSMGVQIGNDLSADQLEELARLMAGIDFTSPNASQNIQNTLQREMPGLKLQQPVITETRSFTITSGEVDEAGLREIFDRVRNQGPGASGEPGACHKCGRQTREGLQFCLGCGAALNDRPPASPPTFGNDWARPVQLQATSEVPSNSAAPLLIGLALILVLVGAAAMYIMVS